MYVICSVYQVINCDPTHRTHLGPRGQVVSSQGRSRHWTQGRWTLRPVSIIYRVGLACPKGQTDLPVLDLSAERKETCVTLKI